MRQSREKAMKPVIAEDPFGTDRWAYDSSCSSLIFRGRSQSQSSSLVAIGRPRQMETTLYVGD
jgi:hypothetical protein